MKDFESFRLTICKNDRPDGAFFAIEANLPKGEDPPPHKWMDGPSPTRAKRNVSFYLYLSEFVPLIKKQSFFSLADGYHKLEVSGDLWTFFDFEQPVGNHGVREVPWINVRLPRRAARVLWRYARLKMRTMGPGQRETVEITQAQRDRLCARYGQGTGKVRVECAPVCEARFQIHLGDPEFRERMDRLEQIARNTTTTCWQEARVRLRPDSSGFIFECLTPDGRTSMWGGLIYHEPGVESYAVEIDPPAGPHWSIHT